MTCSFALCVPCLNAGPLWETWLNALEDQTVKPEHVVIIDSGSSDGTREAAEARGYHVVRIPKSSFDHGGTRQLALDLVGETSIVVYLTQDAILAHREALNNIIEAFADPAVGAVFGRQLPRKNANAIEAHARYFNYPKCNRVTSLNDIKIMGIKAAFFSNSFGAYRNEAIRAVGGFPAHCICGEDAIVAARLLMNNWKISYCADAQVYHSHNYTVVTEFRRYFDIGVFHRQASWLTDQFGKPMGEGMRYVRSEIQYLITYASWRIPEAVLRTLSKYCGYHLGKSYSRLPQIVQRYSSMNRGFWN